MKYEDLGSFTEGGLKLLQPSDFLEIRSEAVTIITCVCKHTHTHTQGPTILLPLTSCLLTGSPFLCQRRRNPLSLEAQHPNSHCRLDPGDLKASSPRIQMKLATNTQQMRKVTACKLAHPDPWPSSCGGFPRTAAWRRWRGSGGISAHTLGAREA